MVFKSLSTISVVCIGHATRRMAWLRCREGEGERRRENSFSFSRTVSLSTLRLSRRYCNDVEKLFSLMNDKMISSSRVIYSTLDLHSASQLVYGSFLCQCRFYHNLFDICEYEYYIHVVLDHVVQTLMALVRQST